MIEVFNEISKRMVQGLMFHEQMADYFDFLNLHGFKRWHENRYIEESCNMRGIHRYAINHCNKLVYDGEIKGTQYIPTSWYNYTRTDVDASTRKQAVKEAFEKWYSWEKETKELYEKLFKKLTDSNKIADANKVNEIIKAVDMELKQVLRKMLEYKAVDYDMAYILYQQPELHEKYEKEMEEVYKVQMC